MRAQIVIPVLASISILVLSLVIADMPNTYAHDTIDQNALQASYDGAIDITKGAPDTGQTFKPQSTNIVAVDIDVSDSKASGTSSPVDVTVRILDGGTLASRELGSVTKSVTLGGTFAAPQTEHFDFHFAPEIKVIPGNTYTITVETANSPEDLKWLCRGGNPYPDGENISSGVVATCDQGFATYSGVGLQDNVIICHVLQKTGEEITITVGAAAVASHLAHGDTLGACE